ncbi:Antitoxin component YafN of the YafNO toxin-antitoxin module, PHD/YefM family [Desulfitobacterium chlororespirans DSM 11544]|uniref:Antitoxin n=2 Tax=Desulfitobacteriaceae TaxID=2937909 RepID=A0A1M7UTY0_9FIRM|nr:Antitoxin component YafN of the YafNO toxin-antitoxin module, PHD/YefM family [Desulfitobacterium chlororespirans DSM 11544]
MKLMININATKLRKDLFNILSQTIKFNEPVNVSTKDGNAVLISEEDYNGLIETVYLSSVPELKDKIVEGIRTPLSECVPEDEVSW